jgi:hypothetical protein
MKASLVKTEARIAARYEMKPKLNLTWKKWTPQTETNPKEIDAVVEHQEVSNKEAIVETLQEHPANTQVKKETIHSWRARDVRALAILRKSACTDKELQNGGATFVGYSEWAAWRMEKCDMETHYQVTAV